MSWLMDFGMLVMMNWYLWVALGLVLAVSLIVSYSLDGRIK